MAANSFDAGIVSGLSLADFEAAAERIASDIVRTPVLPYFGDDRRRIMLKPENLQPLGSFKIRCAANAASMVDAATVGRIATASAGNFAQGLALAARRRSIPLTVHVPKTAARVKIASLSALGAEVVEHDFDAWWAIMTTRETGADDGSFIHPVSETAVVAGNGTIGLELADQLPSLDTVVIPYGGGGLCSGIALALRARGVRARIVAVEVATATPFSSARDAGEPVTVVRAPSFVDGIGSTRVLAEMWPLVSKLIDEVVIVSEAEVRSALHSAFVDNHLVLEGAGAAALAGARKVEGDTVCAVLSGGNIDAATFAQQMAKAEGSTAP